MEDEIPSLPQVARTHAPASTLVRAWAGSLAIALAVIVVRGLAEPWRGIVDFAVAAALSWATVVLIVSVARCCRSAAPPGAAGDACLLNILNIAGLCKSSGSARSSMVCPFAIDEAEKVGFIGVNGSGKSTLFRIVAGIEGVDEGDTALRRGAAVRYRSQEPEFAPGPTILEAVAEGRPALRAAFAGYEEVSRQLADQEADHDRLVDRQAGFAATIDRLHGWDWTHQVEAMLTRLGVLDAARRRVEWRRGEAGGADARTACAARGRPDDRGIGRRADPFRFACIGRLTRRASPSSVPA